MNNLENVRKWVTALESGEYPQGRQRLALVQSNGSVSYCCLGIVCELAIQNGVEMDIQQISGRKYRVYDGAGDLLPRNAKAWLGTHLDDPIIFTLADGAHITAAKANDGLNWTFKQIAAAVRFTVFHEPLPANFPTDKQIYQQLDNRSYNPSDIQLVAE